MSRYKHLASVSLVSVFASLFLFAGSASAATLEKPLPLREAEKVIEKQEKKVTEKTKVLGATAQSVQELAQKKEELAKKLEEEKKAIEELNRKIAEKKAAAEAQAAQAAAQAAEAERQRVQQARSVWVAPAYTPAPAPVRVAGNYPGNGYVPGQCTWYVKNRRPDLPNNLGNANMWYSNAAARGFAVGSAPRVGAVATTTAGPYGHLAYVESVSGNMVTVSEMNWGGPYRMNTRTVPASTFLYIY